MRISLSAFGVSVGARVGRAIGERVELACRAFDATEQVTPGRFMDWTEAGCLLAAALAPVEVHATHVEVISTMQLRQVLLSDGRRTVTLSPSDTAEHALLKGCILPTLGETFGQALKAGADLSHAGGAGPAAWGVTIMDDAIARVGAEVAMRFGESLYVTACFGSDVADAGATTQRVLRHPAIFDIGAGAADFSEPAIEGTPVADVQVLIARAEAEQVGGFIQ